MRWGRVAGGVAAVVVLAATTVALTRSHGHRDPSAPLVAQLAPAPSSTTATPAPASSAARTSSTPVAGTIHELVAPAVPVAFEIKGKAFDIKARVCSMPYVRPLDPPGDQRHTVCWVDSQFGVAPGSTATGTSYILGHAWAEAPLVFNPLSITAMKQVDGTHPVVISGVATYPITALNGYLITVRTAKGTLTYTVRNAYAVRKEQAGNVLPLMAAGTPNRVVLITCGVRDGVDIDDNVIVNAYLSSSVAA